MDDDPREHTVILYPLDLTQPEGFQNRHKTDRLDENLVFDARCPRCRFDRKDKGEKMKISVNRIELSFGALFLAASVWALSNSSASIGEHDLWAFMTFGFFGLFGIVAAANVVVSAFSIEQPMENADKEQP